MSKQTWKNNKMQKIASCDINQEMSQSLNWREVTQKLEKMNSLELFQGFLKC